MRIRKTKHGDWKAVTELLDQAFKGQAESKLVLALIGTESFISELSLVAEDDSQIIGYILFTKAQIVEEGFGCETLVLAPMAVLPSFQKQGFGSALVRFGLEEASRLGFTSVIVLGHREYYPRFGFKPASDFQITAPWKVPDEVFMALELKKDALKGVKGLVQHAEPFSMF